MIFVSGAIAKIMSWRGFQIATRLSYSIYLTQFPVFFYNVGQTRNAQYYEFFSNMVSKFNLYTCPFRICFLIRTYSFKNGKIAD